MRVIFLASFIIASATCALEARAQTSAPEQAEVAGWDAFIDGMRDLPDRMLARLPENMRDDPQVRQEVGRMALAAFTSAAIDALGSDGDHPAFIPQIGQMLNVGQPNADTIYRVAYLTPGGSYRLRGERGSLRMIRVRQAGAGRLGPGSVDLDLNAVPVDANGRFDVLMSAERPAGYEGAWWRLEPITNVLLVRLVSSDWGAERDPTLSIERIDMPVERSRPLAADLERRLRAVPAGAERSALRFIDHVAQLWREGVVNRVRPADFSQIGGLTVQFYYEGVYDLRDDEALIQETRVPAHCAYWSVILTNELYETTDWYNNQSSLNNAQAVVDADGVMRVVISARAPRSKSVRSGSDSAAFAFVHPLRSEV